eukprot:5891203-Amphidinium_carterae.1
MGGDVRTRREVFVFQPYPERASGVMEGHSRLYQLEGPDGPERGVEYYHAHAKEQSGSQHRYLRCRRVGSLERGKFLKDPGSKLRIAKMAGGDETRILLA